MSHSLLRRQTKPQVNKEKGEKQEADVTQRSSSCLFSSSVRSCCPIRPTGKVHTCENVNVNVELGLKEIAAVQLHIRV